MTKVREVRNEIERLGNEKYQIEAKQKALKVREFELNLEQKAIDQQAKLDERRKMAITREKLLRLHEKSFPECPHFIGQLKAFNHRWDAWIKAQNNQSKILEYIDEMNLISDIGKQYKLCVGVLERELGRNLIQFRVELNIWKAKIEKELKALKKGNK